MVCELRALNHLLLALATCVICGSAAVNAFGETDEAPTDQTAVHVEGQKEFEKGPSVQGCTIERYRLHSPSMRRSIELAVVLPPGYAEEPAQRFPVLYALHGANAPYDTWARMPTLRSALSDQPMIVVCFSGDRASLYVDSPVLPESQFMTFFFEELIPHIDAAYRSRADKDHRGVTGFSMGAFGAWNYMLAQPEMFSSVSGLSGAYEAVVNTDGTPRPRAERVMGDYTEHRDAYHANAIHARLDQAVSEKTELPALMIACGSEDFLIASSRYLRDFLAERDVACEYHEAPGEHDWSYWKATAPRVIDFHWRHFTDDEPGG